MIQRIRNLASTGRGRVILAVAVAVVVVLVLAVSRRLRGAAAASPATPTVVDDPTLDAGEMPKDVYAAPIPSGGFDFQDLGGSAASFDALVGQLDGLATGLDARLDELDTNNASAMEQLAQLAQSVAGIATSGASSPASTTGTTGNTGTITQPTTTVTQSTPKPPAPVRHPVGVYKTGAGAFFWQRPDGVKLNYALGVAEMAEYRRVVERAKANSRGWVTWQFKGHAHQVYSTGTVRPV